MGFTGVLLLGSAGQPGQQPNALVQLVPFLLIFAVFYFLVFAPMRKKQRVHQEMISALKAGDRVITNGGIHGTVVGVTDDLVQIRIADKVKIDVSRSAVAALQNTDG